MSGGAAEVLQTLQDILDLLVPDTSPDDSPSAACAIDPAPCRYGLYPGFQVPWDSCGEGPCGDRNGQLWGVLQSMTPVSQGGLSGDPCTIFNWVGKVGIVRCVTGLDDAGEPPDMDSVTADAWQQALDADAIRSAIKCCPLRSARVRDIVVSGWTALGPQGNCAGGEWELRGVYQLCCG